MKFIMAAVFILLNPLLVTAEFSGQLQLGHQQFADEKPAYQSAIDFINLDSEYKYDFLGLRLQTAPWVSAMPGLKDEAQKIRFEPRDTFAQYRRGSAVIRLGYNLVTWTSTDFLNPLDIVHQKDWTDPFKPISRSSPSVMYMQSFGDFSMEWIFIFRATESRFAGAHSPWWPRDLNLPLQTNDVQFLLPKDPLFEVVGGEELNHALSNNIAANFKYRWDFAEIQVAGFDGSATPLLNVSRIQGTTVAIGPPTVIQLNQVIQIKPVYFRVQKIAGSLQFEFYKTLFKLAGNHQQAVTQDIRIAGWSQNQALSAEKNFIFKSGILTVIAQHLISKTQDQDTISGTGQIWQSAHLLGMRWARESGSSMMLGLVNEPKSKLNFGYFNWKFKIQDWLDIDSSAQVISTSENPLMQAFRDHDNFSLQTTIYF